MLFFKNYYVKTKKTITPPQMSNLSLVFIKQ